MTMTDSYKNILQKYYVKLIDDLEPESVVPHLWAESIISYDDKEEILLTKFTRGQKSGILLGMLRRRGQQAFLKFVEALEKVQPFLACMLLKEEKTMLAAEVADRDQQLMVQHQITAQQKKKIEQLQRKHAKQKANLERAENERNDLIHQLRQKEGELREVPRRNSGNASGTLNDNCMEGAITNVKE